MGDLLCRALCSSAVPLFERRHGAILFRWTRCSYRRFALRFTGARGRRLRARRLRFPSMRRLCCRGRRPLSPVSGRVISSLRLRRRWSFPSLLLTRRSLCRHNIPVYVRRSFGTRTMALNPLRSLRRYYVLIYGRTILIPRRGTNGPRGKGRARCRRSVARRAAIFFRVSVSLTRDWTRGTRHYCPCASSGRRSSAIFFGWRTRRTRITPVVKT